MRLQRFLVEDYSDYKKPTVHSKALVDNDRTDDILQTLKEDCSQWITETKGNLVYRGTDKPVRNMMQIGHPRTDRKPRDTEEWVHEAMDKGLDEKFGWKPRSEGVFVTGDVKQANKYGIEYVIFPHDGYKYVWSPKVKDLYLALYSFDSPLLSGIDKFLSIFMLDNAVDEWMKEKQMATAVKSYKDTDIIKAIKSGNEIIVKCSNYYIVDTRVIDLIKDRL